MTDYTRTPDVGHGQALREYRLGQTPRMTQGHLADLLNVDQSHISRIETGEQKVRSIDFLWRIVKRLGIEPRRLGISPELMDVIGPEQQEEAYQAAVTASHQHWLAVRQHLNQHRSDLALLAASLYASTQRSSWEPPNTTAAAASPSTTKAGRCSEP